MFQSRQVPIKEGRQFLAETLDLYKPEPNANNMTVAMWKSIGAPQVARELVANPRLQELGFEVALLKNKVSLEDLRAAGRSENDPRWERDLQQLNGSSLVIEKGYVQSDAHVLLLPYPYVRTPDPAAPCIALEPSTLGYVKAQNHKEMLAAMGAHYWQSAVVTIHQDYIPDPAPDAGHNRVLIHEVGHALDHSISRIQNDDIGKKHREKMTALFEQASEFSSSRAKDNVREFFAEAVESYLTFDQGDALEPKPHNNRDWLEKNAPELFTYIDDIFHREFPENLVLEALPTRPNYPSPVKLLAHYEKSYKELP